MGHMFAILAAGLLVGADDAKKTDPLVGDWNVISMTTNGMERPDAKQSTVTFANSKMTIHTGPREQTATYTLDESKTPATIDLVPGDGPEKGKTLKGIFSLDKDQLKLCFAHTTRDRPTEFASKPGEETVFVVMKKSDKK